MKSALSLMLLATLMLSASVGSANPRDGTANETFVPESQVFATVNEELTLSPIVLNCYSWDAEVQVTQITVLDPCRKETFKAVIGPVKEYESPELKRNHGPPTVRMLS